MIRNEALLMLFCYLTNIVSLFNAQVGVSCRLRNPCGSDKKCIDTCDCPGYRCTGLTIIPIKHKNSYLAQSIV